MEYVWKRNDQYVFTMLILKSWYKKEHFKIVNKELNTPKKDSNAVYEIGVLGSVLKDTIYICCCGH